MVFMTKNDLHEVFTYVFYDFKDIPYNTFKLHEISRKNDGVNFLVEGKLDELLISSFKDLMPMTYDFLTKGIFFYAVKKSDIPILDDFTRFGIIVNDVVYYISYNPYCEDRIELDNYNIPNELQDSWFRLSNGWCVAEGQVPNIYKTNLPSLLLMPLHTLIEGFEDKKGTALPQYTEFLEKKFNCAFRQSYEDDKFNDDEKYFELRCLLDTRANDDWSKSGYQLFVSSHNDERNVYVIPRADVMGIKKLINPADVIDRYAAHLFSRAEGEFDFMQYAEDF